MGSFKTYTCVICGKEVTKPKSLHMKELNSQNGRACKHHHEVQSLGAAKKKKESRFRIEMMATYVRLSCTFEKKDVETAYNFLCINGASEQDIEQVKKEVAKRGGPIMTYDEAELIRATAPLFVYSKK